MSDNVWQLLLVLLMILLISLAVSVPVKQTLVVFTWEGVLTWKWICLTLVVHNDVTAALLLLTAKPVSVT